MHPRRTTASAWSDCPTRIPSDAEDRKLDLILRKSMHFDRTYPSCMATLEECRLHCTKDVVIDVSGEIFSARYVDNVNYGKAMEELLMGL